MSKESDTGNSKQRNERSKDILVQRKGCFKGEFPWEWMWHRPGREELVTPTAARFEGAQGGTAEKTIILSLFLVTIFSEGFNVQKIVHVVEIN